jgi:hypothetical protein
VIACAGTRPGIGLLNAERFRELYSAPAIHGRAKRLKPSSPVPHAPRPRASSRKADILRWSLKRRHRDAWLPALLSAGGGNDAAQLVVAVTAERGGGLVCWLESLRAPPGCDVVFIANSGHELSHLGLDDFIARRPGWERPMSEGGATWIHFGANIGAAGGELLVQSANDDLRELSAAELTRAEQAPGKMGPKTLAPSGETRDIHRAGGRYITLVGSNPLFHLQQDRWPHAVDADVVTRVAATAAALVVKLTR